jgi:hypothetical protein
VQPTHCVNMGGGGGEGVRRRGVGESGTQWLLQQPGFTPHSRPTKIVGTLERWVRSTHSVNRGEGVRGCSAGESGVVLQCSL